VVALTVWRLDTPEAAGDAVARLRVLPREALASVADLATVAWAEDAARPTTRRLDDLTGASPLGAGFWGVLFGVLFTAPSLGRPPDDDFVAVLRSRLRPGTSAVLAIAVGPVDERVSRVFDGIHAELLRDELAGVDEVRLLELLRAD
jgi:uncharacterized membrane protein